MLTKNKIKIIRSLANKKERYSQGRFVIEGEKIVNEALKMGIVIEELIVREDLQDRINSSNYITASKKDLERCSALKHSPGVLAICPFIKWDPPKIASGKYIMLDGVNDPGNLGTIIRIADWFGISGIICSKETVDVYNQKVVQASMASVFRVPVWYYDLNEFIDSNSGCKFIAADLKGEDLNSFTFPSNGILIMGSESHGISENLLSRADHKLTIPRVGDAESLNVSVATGIICAKFSAQAK
jgi:TrmH family RNA methyltransferase